MAKLNIAVSNNRHMAPDFVRSLAHLLVVLAQQSPFEGLGFHLKTNVSMISIGRHDTVHAAIAAGFTHILLLDDDMVFPANAVHRLFAHGKRIVGVNYRKKIAERHYTARRLDGAEMPVTAGLGLEEASRMGFGVMLVDLDVFRRTPPPHFDVPWNGEGYRGEDHSFANAVRAGGEQLWVDHDLSAQCGHVGDYPYAP